MVIPGSQGQAPAGNKILQSLPPAALSSWLIKRSTSCARNRAHSPPPDRSFPTAALVGSVGKPPTVCDTCCHSIVACCGKYNETRILWYVWMCKLKMVLYCFWEIIKLVQKGNMKVMKAFGFAAGRAFTRSSLFGMHICSYVYYERLGKAWASWSSTYRWTSVSNLPFHFSVYLSPLLFCLTPFPSSRLWCFLCPIVFMFRAVVESSLRTTSFSERQDPPTTSTTALTMVSLKTRMFQLTFFLKTDASNIHQLAFHLLTQNGADSWIADNHLFMFFRQKGLLLRSRRWTPFKFTSKTPTEKKRVRAIHRPAWFEIF